MSELNIQLNNCKLMLEALNKHRSKTDAAKSLGVTLRTVINWVNKYKVTKIKNKYVINNT